MIIFSSYFENVYGNSKNLLGESLQFNILKPKFWK